MAGRRRLRKVAYWFGETGDLAKRPPRELVVAACFTAAFIAFEAAVVRHGYGQFLTYSTYRGPAWVALGCGLILISYALTLLFVWASLRARRRSQWLYLGLFAAILFLQYGYKSALNGFATADDFMLAVWGTSEFQKRGMALSYVSWTAAIPSAMYAMVLWRFRSGTARLVTDVATLGLIMLLTAPSLYLLSRRDLAYYSAYPTTSVTAFFRMLTEVVWRSRALLHGERDDVTYASQDRPDHNIVFIVDESVRGDHLSLNGFERLTTPYLEGLQRDGRVSNWGLAVSGANCSEGANLLLWTGVPSRRLPATGGEIHSWPSLMQYAKAMGYRTYYIDGQMQRFWIARRLDLRHIDHWMTRSDLGGSTPSHEIDFLIADRVRDIVDRSTANFIWVNKRGVHAPYFEAFPEHAAMWHPYAREYRAPHLLDHSELLNAYDNAIRYNVDGFFRRLDMPSRRPGTLIVYTSDHGQSLSERREPYYHCSDLRSVTRADKEAIVPLLMARSGSRPPDPGAWLNRASHENLFSTVLDLMGFPEAERNRPYAPSLLGQTVPEHGARRYYLGSSIDGHSPLGALVTFAE